MVKTKMNFKDIKKAINAKAKVKKAGKAVTEATKAVGEFMKGVDSVAIGFSENKHIQEIAFEKKDKEITLKVTLK